MNTLFVFVLLAFSSCYGQQSFTFDTSNTVRNPQRGLVPFGGGNWDPCGSFPCSMENTYISFISVMKNWNQFDFTPIDNVLKSVASRQRQSILRIYVDYPELDSRSLNTILPAFLAGNVQSIDNGDGTGVHPDYNNADLIKALVQLIQAAGQKYDGDNRIAIWQVGLLGHWGEWHNYPTNDFASAANQDAIISAYTSSFTKTKLVNRYPNKMGTKKPSQVNMGYIDDSFLYDTYGSEDWYFYNQLASVGATEIWKTQPIGGEVYPPLHECAFTGRACGTDWYVTVDKIHASWMWLNKAFEYSGSQRDAAIKGSLALGYHIHVEKASATSEARSVGVAVTVVNKGNAPFYYPLSLVATCGQASSSVLLNTASGVYNTYRLNVTGVHNGTVSLTLKSEFVAPGQVIRFADREDNNGVLSVKVGGSVVTATSDPIPTTSSGGDGGYGEIDDNSDRVGNDIAATIATSARDCQAQCYNNKACVAFTFNSCGNDCWLKSSIGSKISAACRQSGVITAGRTTTSNDSKSTYTKTEVYTATRVVTASS